MDLVLKQKNPPELSLRVSAGGKIMRIGNRITLGKSVRTKTKCSSAELVPRKLNALPKIRLFANAGLAHVEVKMVIVGVVIFRPQNGPENAAGIISEILKEPAFFGILAPVI